MSTQRSLRFVPSWFETPQLGTSEPQVRKEPLMSESTSNREGTALKRAAFLTLAVAGGVSALFFSFSPTSAGDSAAPATVTPTIVTEYVDANGNPVDPTTLANGQENIVYVDENGLPYTSPPAPVALSTSAAPANAASMAPEEAYEEYEEDEEDEEYEEYEEDEDPDYEDGDHDD